MVYVREQIQTAVPWEGLLGYRGSAWAPPAATEVLFRELPVSHFLFYVIHVMFVKLTLDPISPSFSKHRRILDSATKERKAVNVNMFF